MNGEEDAGQLRCVARMYPRLALRQRQMAR